MPHLIAGFGCSASVSALQPLTASFGIPMVAMAGSAGGLSGADLFVRYTFNFNVGGTIAGVVAHSFGLSSVGGILTRLSHNTSSYLLSLSCSMLDP